MRTRWVLFKGDMGDPAERQRQYSLGYRKDMIEWGSNATREEVVVTDVERRGRRESDGIGRDKEVRDEGANPGCLVWCGR